VRLCSARGVTFSVSSDAHRGGSVGNLIWSERVLRDAGVSPEQIVDPMDLVRGRRVRKVQCPRSKVQGRRLSDGHS